MRSTVRRASDTVLVFTQHGVDPEPAQREFVREVQAWATGHVTNYFATPDDLRDAVTAALRDAELSRAVGPVDESEMLGRARALLLGERETSELTLSVVVAGGPKQQVVRPREMEASNLEETISREALFGQLRILDRTAGSRAIIRDNALTIAQQGGSVLLDEFGTVRVTVAAGQPRSRTEFGLSGVAIQEDIEERIQRILRFVGWVVDHVDPMRRISDVVPLVALYNVMTWRTRAEHERQPNSFQLRTSAEPAIVHLTPARRHRAALTQDALRLAEDLATLLARKARP